jgi:hypothetical protein
LIDEYFQTVLQILQASPYVKSHNVTFDRRSLTAGYIRGDVYFADDSLLHFREFVNTESDIDRFTYVFHYQRADGSLLFRYDNTAHFPTLDGFPHHKHVEVEDHVVASAAVDLAQVIREIEERLIAA